MTTSLKHEALDKLLLRSAPRSAFRANMLHSLCIVLIYSGAISIPLLVRVRFIAPITVGLCGVILYGCLNAAHAPPRDDYFAAEIDGQKAV